MKQTKLMVEPLSNPLTGSLQLATTLVETSSHVSLSS